MSLIIRDVMIVTMDPERRVIQKGALAVREDRICAVGDTEEILRAHPDITDIRSRPGRVVYPGLINIHTHAALSLIRGVAEDLGTAPAYTPSVPQGGQLSAHEAGVMAMLGAAEALRFGSTLIADNYLYSSESAAAFSALGIRAVVSERLHDISFDGLPHGRYQEDPALGEALLQKNVDLIQRWDGRGRIRCCLGPHAPDTCTPAYLGRIADLAAQLGVGTATHLAQSRREVERLQQRYGRTGTQYFEDCGLLGPGMVAAHGVYLTKEDIALLAKRGVTIAHAAEGNAKGGMAAPVMALRSAGVNVGIATDNGSADMLEAMRMALCAARMREGSCVSPQPMEILEMATINGARALGMEQELGSLEAGKKADFIVVDYRKPHLCPCINAVGNLLHTALGSDIETVVVDGETVVDGGQLLTVDTAALLREAQEIAQRRWYAVNEGLDRRLTLEG